jgi:hypothetical protein
MMHYLVNVLQLAVAVALASVTSLSTTSTPVLATAVAQICQQVSGEPAKAKIYYNDLLTKLNEKPEVQKNFKNTLAYLQLEQNEDEFLAGGQTCRQFFAGLKATLLADYEALSPQAAADKVAQHITDFIAKIQAAIQANKG